MHDHRQKPNGTKCISEFYMLKHLHSGQRSAKSHEIPGHRFLLFSFYCWLDRNIVATPLSSSDNVSHYDTSPSKCLVDPAHTETSMECFTPTCYRWQNDLAFVLPELKVSRPHAVWCNVITENVWSLKYTMYALNNGTNYYKLQNLNRTKRCTLMPQCRWGCLFHLQGLLWPWPLISRSNQVINSGWLFLSFIDIAQAIQGVS